LKPFPRKVALMLAFAAGALVGWWLLNPGRPDRFRLYSKVLGESRHILVHLPEGYTQGFFAYPLLVLLDGGDQKQFSGDKPLYSRSREVLARLEREGLPPMILVGIANRDRVRDMTPIQRPDIYAGGGGAEAFMGFIEMEVLPYVESHWRINSTRILYGESYGGLFVLDALARGKQAFSDYIAISPTIGVWPQGLAEAFRRRFAGLCSIRSLFIVCGERDIPLVSGYAIDFFRAIEGFLPPGLRRRLEILPGEAHDPIRSLELGLRYVFSMEIPLKQ
jgi:predicted alpha/beta superfamily hydrolase